MNLSVRVDYIQREVGRRMEDGPGHRAGERLSNTSSMRFNRVEMTSIQHGASNSMFYVSVYNASCR